MMKLSHNVIASLIGSQLHVATVRDHALLATERRMEEIVEAEAFVSAIPVLAYGSKINAAFAADLRIGLVGFTVDEGVVEKRALEALQRVLTLHHYAGGTCTDLHGRVVQVDLRPQMQGEDPDIAATQAITAAVAGEKLTMLLVSPDVRTGVITSTEVAELCRQHNVVVLYPDTAKDARSVLGLVSGFSFESAATLAARVNGNAQLNSALHAKVEGDVVTVSGKYYHDDVKFTATVEAGVLTHVNGITIKRRNALLVENQRFALGGDTLVAVVDSNTIFAAALGVLAYGLNEISRYYVDSLLFSWMKSLEGFMVDRPMNRRKQSGATQRFNRDNVMGAYTIVGLEKGFLGKAHVHTAGVCAQLRHTVGEDAAFLPAAKGDYVITYSRDELNSLEHVWYLTPDGRLAAHTKGTKHTAAHHANTCGSVELDVMMMPGTPFCNGGAMPIDDEALADATGVEEKTLARLRRNFIDPKVLADRKAEGRFQLLVAEGQVIVPGQPIAIMDGRPVTWNERKGGAWAVVMDASLVESEERGRLGMSLLVRAFVGYNGVFKGREFGKVMATPNGITHTVLEQQVAADVYERFRGAFVSSGAVKVSADFTKTIIPGTEREGFGRITRKVTEKIMAILVALYGPGGQAEDKRFSFDQDAMTVTWAGAVRYARVKFGIESSHVGETMGYTAPIPTMISFVTAADQFGSDDNGVGIGTSVLRDLYGNKMIDRAERLTYAKVNGSSAKTQVILGDKEEIVVGWVDVDVATNKPKHTVRQFADTAGRPALADLFDAEMSDVELLQGMAKTKHKQLVVVVKHNDIFHAAELDFQMILGLSNAGSQTGQLAGLGSVAAELLRCVLFPEVAKTHTSAEARVALISKFRRQLRSLAKSGKLNRIYRHKVGVIAKVIPSWCLPEDTWAVSDTGPVNRMLAELYGVDTFTGDDTWALTGRHPVTAMAVSRIIVIPGLDPNVILVNEVSFRTKTKGDTDGDQGIILAIKEAEKAVVLRDAFEQMLPDGDINLAVLGVSSNDPRSKLFGELPKVGETTDSMLSKDVDKDVATWGRQLDEQAHTALVICGSSYKLGEFAAYLAGLGRVTATTCLVGTLLYEDRGLNGEAARTELKKAMELFHRGLTTKKTGSQVTSLERFRQNLCLDLSKGIEDEVTLGDETKNGLGIASEFAWIARRGGIPMGKDGEQISRIGGTAAHYDELWRIVAVLQAMGRGQVTAAEHLIADLTLDSVLRARDIIGENFLLDMVEVLARVMQPKVALLKKHNLLDDQKVVKDDGGLEDEVELDDGVEDVLEDEE